MTFQDLRYAVRMLLKDPVFLVVAVLSLSLGTGANATMFSLVNGILLRPLPVSRPGEVLTIAPKLPDNSFGGISYPDYVDIRDSVTTMRDLTASTLYRVGFSRSRDALPVVKYGLLVTGNLFQAMGVTPMLGRAFTAEEGQVPGRDAVVLLGHDFWKQEFGGDPQVIGRTIYLNGLDFTVIGVTPETFTGMDEFFKATMFIPIMMVGRLGGDPTNNLLEKRNWRDLGVKGRLKEGISAAQAEAELAGIAKALEQKYPATNAGEAVTLLTEMQVHIQHMPQESGFMAMAMIMAGLVLLISCFNVANLLLSRARTREIAIRLAVGASRGRLARLLLTESLLIAVLGMAGGLWLGWIAGKLFSRIKVPSDLPFMIDVRTDDRVLLFSVAVGVLSVLFFGLVPALQSSKLDLVTALKAMDSAAVSGRNPLWGRNVLVIAQIAISVVILVAVTIVFNSFRSQLSGDAGIRSKNILMMSFDPRLIRYDDDQIREFYRLLIEQARKTPGVKSVATGLTMPLAINQRGSTLQVTRGDELNTKDKKKDVVLFSSVDEHFFETMSVPIVRGRSFQVSDTEDSPRVVVVNEAFAEKRWPGEDPLGKQLEIETGNYQLLQVEVVGVAKTARYVWLSEAPTDYLYLALSQNYWPRRTLFIESYGDSASLTGPIREIVRGLDSNMPVYDVRTIEEYFAAWIAASANTLLYMIGSMGLTGLVLATIGLYGLVAYSVSRRTREFGIRMAIGAGKGSVLRMVLGQGVLLCAGGIVAGIAMSIPASHAVGAIVFGASADWLPYIVVPAVLLMVTLLAIYGPARRASRIDPMKALRDE